MGDLTQARAAPWGQLGLGYNITRLQRGGGSLCDPLKGAHEAQGIWSLAPLDEFRRAKLVFARVENAPTWLDWFGFR